jgi:hypothetical protein
MLDVGEQQLLVLLLVIQTEQERESERGINVALQALEHRRVDAPAVVADLRQCRPRDQAARISSVHRAGTLIIRIEQEVPLRIERRAARAAAPEHEALEEPGRVRQMPLDGAGIGH